MSTITGAWSLGPLPLRACLSTHAGPDTTGDRLAGQNKIDPHPEVLMEHPRPVVPVGEHPLVRPAIAHYVTQAERLELRQRGPLERGDVGQSDVGLGIEHVVVGWCDVHVATYHGRRRAGETICLSEASQASLY